MAAIKLLHLWSSGSSDNLIYSIAPIVQVPKHDTKEQSEIDAMMAAPVQANVALDAQEIFSTALPDYNHAPMFPGIWAHLYITIQICYTYPETNVQ